MMGYYRQFYYNWSSISGLVDCWSKFTIQREKEREREGSGQAREWVNCQKKRLNQIYILWFHSSYIYQKKQSCGIISMSPDLCVLICSEISHLFFINPGGFLNTRAKCLLRSHLSQNMCPLLPGPANISTVYANATIHFYFLPSCNKNQALMHIFFILQQLFLWVTTVNFIWLVLSIWWACS